MRRMIIAGIIVLIIALLGVWERTAVTKACEDMTLRLTQIGELIEKGDYISAYENAEKINGFWEKKERVLDVLIRHEDTDDIALDIDVLERYILLEDKTLSLSTVDEISGQLEEIQKKTRVHYTNIF